VQDSRVFVRISPGGVFKNPSFAGFLFGAIGGLSADC
jgi:hypothetical protein